MKKIYKKAKIILKDRTTKNKYMTITGIIREPINIPKADERYGFLLFDTLEKGNIKGYSVYKLDDLIRVAKIVIIKGKSKDNGKLE